MKEGHRIREATTERPRLTYEILTMFSLRYGQIFRKGEVAERGKVASGPKDFSGENVQRQTR